MLPTFLYPKEILAFLTLQTESKITVGNTDLADGAFSVRAQLQQNLNYGTTNWNFENW